MLTAKIWGAWWSFLCLDTRRTTVSDSDRLLLVRPATKILVISKPPPTSHNGPVFTFTLRLRHITKITVCSPYTNKRFYKKALDSKGWRVTQKQTEKDRRFFSLLETIGLLSEATVTKAGQNGKMIPRNHLLSSFVYTQPTLQSSLRLL